MTGTWRSRLSYVVRRALQAMVQGPFGAVTITLTIALALSAVGALLGAGELLRRGVDLWGRDLTFSVLLTDDCSEADRGALSRKLALAASETGTGTGPRSTEPRFVSKADALRAMRAGFGDVGAVLDDLPQNPLRDALQVPAANLAGGRLGELRHVLAGQACVADVDDDAQWLAPALRLLAALRVALGGLFALLAAVTLVLVSNTAQLAIYARRDEIGVLKLVGATDAFVRWPFLLEGLIEGLLGGAFAGVLLTVGFAALWPRAVGAVPPLGSLGLHPFPLVRVALGFTGTGALLGFAASGFSVGRFLRV